jgi:beta-lactamase class A
LKHPRQTSLILTLTLLCLAQAVLAQSLTPAARKKLDNDIRYVVGQQSGFGDIAVAVMDSEGVVSQVNGSRPFPLASVFKLPLMIAVLKRQQEGTFPSSGSVLTVTTNDQCIGSGSLKTQGVGATVSVDKAMRLMMSVSDNTATDLLFRKLGCENLDPWLKEQGYKSSEILLTNRQAWLLSLGKVPGWGKTTPEERVSRWEKLDRAGKLALAAKIESAAQSMSLSQFQAIENASTGTQSAQQDNLLAARLDNKMSALDLAKLLVDLDSGRVLNGASRETAFSVLAGQKYHSRLPAKLASTTEIYHKTGTLSGVHDDAGLLYTRNADTGVAVVFLSQNIRPGAGAKMDHVAAQVAKLVESAYR